MNLPPPFLDAHVAFSLLVDEQGKAGTEEMMLGTGGLAGRPAILPQRKNQQGINDFLVRPRGHLVDD
jgi:hypothetical protein